MKEVINHSEQAMTLAKEVLSTRKDDISFNKIRLREKFNAHGVRKMKIYLDLNKEETEAFKQVLDAAKPPEVSTPDFVKAMVLAGINYYMQLAEREAAKAQAGEQEVSEMPNVEIVN